MYDVVMLEDLGRATEGRLGVHDPVGCIGGTEVRLEGVCVVEPSEHALERELALGEGATSEVDEFAPEDLAQHSHGKEEAGAAGDPLTAVGGQSTAGDHTVHVRMVQQVLAPGVEDGQHADARPEMLWVCGDLLEGLCGSTQEDAVHRFLVL